MRRRLNRLLNQAIGWVMAMVMLALRTTVRVRFENDPRPELERRGKGGAVAFLHAHQAAGALAIRSMHVKAMVSRSRDGDLLIPTLRVLGIGYARGSSRKRGKDKGGTKALFELGAFVRDGGYAAIAVDGPQGPRNNVARGIASLANEFDVPILPAVIVPTRRWIAARTWDRLQIPLPFARIACCFGEPIWPEGRSDAELCAVAADVLRDLERRHDPKEAAICHGAEDATAATSTQGSAS